MFRLTIGALDPGVVFRVVIHELGHAVVAGALHALQHGLASRAEVAAGHGGP